MTFLYVVGARPNLVKMAPVLSALRQRLPDGRHLLVHTGQHYDEMMSDVFFAALGLPAPDYMLGVGSGTHAVQTARVMERLEPILFTERPDVVIVAGDVNSTLAAALVAAKLNIPLAHVESGLRSFDRSMPEEINRIVADQCSEFLFTHCDDAIENLRNEGVSDTRMHLVGNTMIDALVAVESRFREADAAGRFGLRRSEYLLVTLHRPALVDGELLHLVLNRLRQVARDLPVIFPVHPRTLSLLPSIGDASAGGLVLTKPLSYIDFLSLEADAAAVLTDSGGVQEETTFLRVPCFTLRDNTERPITITAGTNTLLGLDPDRILEIPDLLAQATPVDTAPLPLWDGRAAERVATVLAGAGSSSLIASQKAL